MIQALPKRLETIISMVPPSSVIADIGCDHAYTSIALVARGIASSAIACDINEGPLQSAQKNIREEQLSQKIETRLGDGLTPVSAGEADTIIIAGMGGLLMQHILTGRLHDFRHFILSPQRDLPVFRRFLIENDCFIQDECMVEEDGKFYTVMHVCPANDNTDEQRKKADALYQSEAEFTYGGWNLFKKDAVLLQFLRKEQARYAAILRKTSSPDITHANKLVQIALEAYQ